MTVSKTMEKVLMDLTGQPQPEMALKSALDDVIAHRLELIQDELKQFENKYKSSFSEFKKTWKEGKLEGKYSHSVEKDYWEWEGLVSRKNKLKGLSKWVS